MMARRRPTRAMGTILVLMEKGWNFASDENGFQSGSCWYWGAGWVGAPHIIHVDQRLVARMLAEGHIEVSWSSHGIVNYRLVK